VAGNSMGNLLEGIGSQDTDNKKSYDNRANPDLGQERPESLPIAGSVQARKPFLKPHAKCASISQGESDRDKLKFIFT
jgi:hypothetical protein